MIAVAPLFSSLEDWTTVKVPLSQPCFDHFFGPCFRAMMKQVCWHSRRSKAYRGLPKARGQSEAHGDSIYILWGYAHASPHNCLFWALVLEPHLLNLAAASCYLHGRFWRQQVPSPLWWRNLLQVLVRELNHFKQQLKALRQASQLCCFACRCNSSLFSDVGPLETIAENKTEQKSAAKRRQRLLKAPQQPAS